MKKENINTTELLRKFMSDKYTEDELLDLFEKVNTIELEKSVAELLPGSFDEIINPILFTKEETRNNYKELSNKLGFNRTIKKTVFSRILRYAAVITIPLIIGVLSTFVFIGNKIQDDAKLTFSVSKGHKGYLELTDGSKVWLNSSSELLYSSNKLREVYLDGEAYFEIAHDSQNKFKVRTDYFDIVVYGTSFNASSYQFDDIVEINLLEGSIGIVDDDKSLFKLKAGQSVLYDKNNKHYTIVDKSMKDISLWTKPELVIRDLTADELFQKLSAWYRVDINLKNKDPKNRLYNLVITNESLENILSLVNKLSPMSYEIEGKEVTIKYKL